jgi:hypothetical protein
MKAEINLIIISIIFTFGVALTFVTATPLSFSFEMQTQSWLILLFCASIVSFAILGLVTVLKKNPKLN